MIRFTSLRSANSRRDCANGSRSSERILLSTISAPRSLSSCESAAPESSCRSPREQASLTVITTARIPLIVLYPGYSLERSDLSPLWPKRYQGSALQGELLSPGAYMFLQPATIHHHEQSGVECALSSILINHTFLKPHCFCAYSNRFINRRSCLIRTAEDINQIDLLLHCKEIRISLLAKDFRFVRIHRD